MGNFHFESIQSLVAFKVYTGKTILFSSGQFSCQIPTFLSKNQSLVKGTKMGKIRSRVTKKQQKMWLGAIFVSVHKWFLCRNICEPYILNSMSPRSWCCYYIQQRVANLLKVWIMAGQFVYVYVRVRTICIDWLIYSYQFHQILSEFVIMFHVALDNVLFHVFPSPKHIGIKKGMSFITNQIDFGLIKKQTMYVCICYYDTSAFTLT